MIHALAILAIWIVVPLPFAIIVGKTIKFGMGDE